MLYLKNTIYYNFSEIITYFTSKFHMEPVWSQCDSTRDANSQVLFKYH